ncbi:MAG: hypothetical protein Q4G54_05925 [Pelistega sp.]|nr:hypothetical protein [Pelistega sp.]
MSKLEFEIIVGDFPSGTAHIEDRCIIFPQELRSDIDRDWAGIQRLDILRLDEPLDKLESQRSFVHIVMFAVLGSLFYGVVGLCIGIMLGFFIKKEKAGDVHFYAKFDDGRDFYARAQLKVYRKLEQLSMPSHRKTKT